MKNILCVYATRQIDSNLFMSSSIFNGLQQCGYKVDMLFCGTKHTCYNFKSTYSQYFDNVYYQELSDSLLLNLCRKNSLTHVAYNFYRGFVMDRYFRPYNISKIKGIIKDDYDLILSFVPIALSAYLAYDVQKYIIPNVRIFQFWTDPLSLGQLDSIHDIPKSRLWHKYIEKSIIKLADKMVFCYPLFCHCMKELYPKYADKMRWSDIAYMKHEKANIKPNNEKVMIGLFGAYQTNVRNIYPLLDTLKEFPNVQFIIRGDSDIIINTTDYPNLDVVQGRIPLMEVEDLEANCDILLCLAGRSGITIPAGKVFYYGDYNKPILYISDGKNKDYASDYMRSFGRYEICENTVESIKIGIRNCINALDGYNVSIPDRIEPATVARKIIEE